MFLSVYSSAHDGVEILFECAEALFQSFLITLTYLMATEKTQLFPFPPLVFSLFCPFPNANTAAAAAAAAVEKRIKLNAAAPFSDECLWFFFF